MLKIWQKAQELGLKNIPNRIANHAGYLPWHDSWNREFLAKYFNIGIDHLNNEDFDNSFWIFSHLLELSPNDNQGARFLAIDSCIGLGRHVKAIEICEMYNRSRGPDAYLHFSKALAMFVTYEADPIENHIFNSIQLFPIFGKLLAQKRKKDFYDYTHFSKPGSISGNKEWAKYYWNQQGRFWKENPEGLEIVRNLYKKFKKQQVK